MEVDETLRVGGYDVHPVSSGEEALAALENDQLQLAGLVTDIRLGDGVPGWDVARRARELRPHFPVVYMTGDSAENHTVQGVPESILLQKPFAPAQLVTAISALLNKLPPEA